jgi:hypothetical protein
VPKPFALMRLFVAVIVGKSGMEDHPENRGLDVLADNYDNYAYKYLRLPVPTHDG